MGLKKIFGLLVRDMNHGLNHGSIDPHDDAKLIKDGLDQNIIPQQSCQRCDWIFSELTTEASKMADIFSLRVRELVHLHFSPTLPRFLSCLFHCFKDDQEALLHKGLILIQFAVMNAIALRKILKKYDKVHNCESGMNYKSKLQAKHLDIIQSPWLIELVALYINVNGSDSLMSDELFGPLTFDFNMSAEESVLTLTLLGSEKYDCSFTCPICLDIVFQPYALSCGHIFCKSCACLAARVLIIDGFKYASPESNCPVCRESGVYAKSVCMPEIGLLLQRRLKPPMYTYWGWPEKGSEMVTRYPGVYPESWIFAITEYFSLLNTPVDQWLKIVGFNLEGATAEWFQWMTRNGLITTWARFEESVRNCFGPSEYEDPNGALSKLLQLGTVKDYQREFEKLMNRATDIPDSLLISFYIFRLKLHLQREFLVIPRPTTPSDAIFVMHYLPRLVGWTNSSEAVR
ncbi:probable E3 ubiquitin-protein ligase BAH1-like protein [Tanacetum coccineum]